VVLKGKKRRTRDLAEELKCVCVREGERTDTVATVYGTGKPWAWLYRGLMAGRWYLVVCVLFQNRAS
jgi:hypothetical protein